MRLIIKLYFGGFQGLELPLSLPNSDTVHLSFSSLIQGPLCRASFHQPKGSRMWPSPTPGNAIQSRHSTSEPTKWEPLLFFSTWMRAITASYWLSAVNHFPLFQNPRIEPGFLEYLDQIQSTSGDVDTLVHCIFESHHMWTSHIMAYVLYCSLYCSMLLLETLCWSVIWNKYRKCIYNCRNQISVGNNPCYTSKALYSNSDKHRSEADYMLFLWYILLFWYLLHLTVRGMMGWVLIFP